MGGQEKSTFKTSSPCLVLQQMALAEVAFSGWKASWGKQPLALRCCSHLRVWHVEVLLAPAGSAHPGLPRSAQTPFTVEPTGLQEALPTNKNLERYSGPKKKKKITSFPLHYPIWVFL